MKRMRAIALGAVGLWGANGWAEEPKAPTVMPVVVPPITFLPAPQVLPTVESDFTKPTPIAPTIPAPAFVKPNPANDVPVFVPGRPEPAIDIVTDSPKPAQFVEPKIEPLPVPLIQLKKSEPPKIDVQPDAPVPPKAITPEPQTLPIPIPQTEPTACEPALEPVPGWRPGLRQRSGVFGSDDIRISRESYLGEAFGFNRRESNEGSVTSRPGFLDLEYLFGWINPQRIPSLLTTNTIPNQFGILGRPGTVSLIGPGTFGPSFHDGMRVRAGQWWGGPCNDPYRGWDASFFFLGNASQSQIFNGNSLSRPFIMLNNNEEFVQVVAFPGISRGSFLVEADRSLWGIDANYKHGIGGTDRGWFAGYRHLNMRESLVMTEFITSLGAPGLDPLGTQVIVQDSFRTHNRFHGGQVGWFSSRKLGQFDLEWRASIALGFTRENVNVHGFQSRTFPNGVNQQFRGGLLAAGPNLGSFDHTAFATVPEASIRLAYQVRPNLRLYLGYNFLYWSSVARPGDQIDRGIDVAFVPNLMPAILPTGIARPAVTFQQADIVLHSLQFGANWVW